MTTDLKTIEAGLALFHDEGEVFEIRLIDAPIGRNYRGTISGYFDSPALAAEALSQYDGQCNIYHTINPIEGRLLARSANKLKQIKGKDPTTADSAVLAHRWLLIDTDPERPAGISSSDEELAAALAARDRIRAHLQESGFSEPVVAMSGNGGHLIYRVDLPRDEESRLLLDRLLAALGARFGTKQVKVDTTVTNPARIWKVYGTVAVKGDNMPDRPHRLALIESAPEAWEVTPIEKLQALAPQAAAAARKPVSGGRISGYTEKRLQAALEAAEIGYKRKQQQTRVIFALDRCLTSDEHADGAAVTLHIRGPEKGKVGYKCHHDSCQGKHWPDVRAQLFPNGPGPAAQPAAEQPFEFKPISAAELLATEWPDPEWLVPGLVPACGLVLLGGRPKLGKSWLMLLWLMLLAIGGELMGEPVRARKVLFIALEDNERRLGRRIQTLVTALASRPDLTNFDIKLEWRDFRQGGLADLEQAIAEGGYEAVVIDTLARALKYRANEYDDSTDAFSGLQRLALEYECAIICVDHHKKPFAGDARDLVDDILGSTAKTGVVDCVLGLYRERMANVATLAATGRDQDDREIALKFDHKTCAWAYVGEADVVAKRENEQHVLEAIEEQGPSSLGQIANYTGMGNKGYLHRVLQNLIEAGLVNQPFKGGKYELAPHVAAARPADPPPLPERAMPKEDDKSYLKEHKNEAKEATEATEGNQAKEATESPPEPPEPPLSPDELKGLLH